jgi:glycine cleavage system H lipoate-binding protein
MSAGILSYQLCDRQLDCDHCPLDAAMRKRYPRPESLPHADPLPGSSPEGLRNDRSYSPNHCWVKEIHDKVVRVGIEPGLGAALLGPKTIVLPAEGQRVNQGQACLWIVMEGGTLPVASPLNGVIRDTNRQLAEKPHMLRVHSLDHGWLFDLELDEQSKSPDLMTADQADPRYGQDEAAFSSLLANALERGHSEVGFTLADGGQQLQSVADMLGASKYFSLLRKVYG